MTLRDELISIVQRFAWGRVLVLGDLLLDEWLIGASHSVAREAPVPTVAVTYREAVPGGAGNTAVNAAALGARTRMLSAVGSDDVAKLVATQLDRRGVEALLIPVPGRITMAKRRVVVGRQVVARFDEGETGPVPDSVDSELAGRLEALLDTTDAIVLADYGLGVCAGPALREVVGGAASHKPLLVDAHRVRQWQDCQPTVVTPNWSEARELLDLGNELSGPARIERLCDGRERLLEMTGSSNVVVTLDGDGAVLLSHEGAHHVPTRRIDEPHSAGAGDTLSAAMAVSLAVGAPMGDALEIAVCAATVVVQRPGTASCSREDLVAGADGPLLTTEALLQVCREHRAAGRRIALTNGCFDVLHAGHVACLRAAAAQADVVVVALNSDAGVRAIKGAGRPVNRVADRAAVLAALGTVDHVVAFDGHTPLALVEAIRPDVYVKGADHDVLSLPEARAVARLGGRVHPVQLLPDRSTSGVIAACAAVTGSTA